MSGNVVINVVGKVDASDLTKLESSLGKLKSTSNETGSTFRQSMLSMAGGMGLAMGASALFHSAVDLVRGSLQAASQEQVSATVSAQNLANLGFGSATQAVLHQLDTYRLMYGFSETQLRPSFDRLVRSTGDVSGAMYATKLAMDISRGTGKDLTTVAAALGKAYDGNMTALQRLGLGLSSTTIKHKDLKGALDQLTKDFGGQASAYTQTFAGKMASLGQIVDITKEAVGKGMVDGLNNLIPTMNNANKVGGIFIGVQSGVAQSVMAIGIVFKGAQQFWASLESASAAAISGILFGVGKVVQAFNWMDTFLSGGAHKHSSDNWANSLAKDVENVAVASAASANQKWQDIQALVNKMATYKPAEIKVPTVSASNTAALADYTNKLKGATTASGGSSAAAKAHSAALKAQAEAHKKATEAAKAHADALKKLQAEQKATADAAAKAAQAQVDAAKAARQSIIDSFNISSAGQSAAGGGTDILTQMKQKLADAQAFAHGIAALKIAGLNSDSLLQLESGGPAGSLDAINQLLNGGANTISQVNSLESQLGQTGTGYGQIQGGFTMASGAVAPGAIVVNFNNNGSVDSATMTQAIQDSITGAFQQLGTQIQSQQTFTGQGGRRV